MNILILEYSVANLLYTVLTPFKISDYLIMVLMAIWLNGFDYKPMRMEDIQWVPPSAPPKPHSYPTRNLNNHLSSDGGVFGPSGDSCNGEGTAGPAQQSYMRLVYYSDAAGLRPMQRPTGAYFTIWFCIDHHLMPHTPTMMRVPPSVAGDEGASLCRWKSQAHEE